MHQPILTYQEVVFPRLFHIPSPPPQHSLFVTAGVANIPGLNLARFLSETYEPDKEKEKRMKLFCHLTVFAGFILSF